MIKKYFLLIISIILGIPTLVSAASCPLQTNSAYKTSAGPGVFYVMSDCTKRIIPDQVTYFTFFNSWGNIKKTTTNVLKNIPNNSKLFLTITDKGTVKPVFVKSITNNKPVTEPVKRWVLTATVSSTVKVGQIIPIHASFTATRPGNYYLVDIEVYDSNNKKIAQDYYDLAPFTDVLTRSYIFYWTVPPKTLPGNYKIKLGAFTPHWATTESWNDNAANFKVITQ